MLGYNSVEDLRVTKIAKEIKFERVWGELKPKTCFWGQSFTKYLRLTLVFMWNSAPWEKFNFLFFKGFLLVLTKLLFWQKDWALDYHSMEFSHFPDTS